MWRHTLRDLTPADDPEEWANALAEEGWRLWIPGNNGAETDNRGIYEYLLDGKQNPQLLNVRLFDASTKRQAYKAQTTAAKAAGKSNCPLCAHGSNANKERLYELKEMEADHVTAWSKGGQSTLANCEMLCVPHNRSKGNR
ncbi:HNH endonuclease [Janibacter hoylei]|uniref:HNH endonuclease n=1 Tax=Janibacter hoylei TaxID=364298 RepID=UPI0024923732|nr:HNH endonuclease [Janibacter hoylei]